MIYSKQNKIENQRKGFYLIVFDTFLGHMVY